MVQELQDLVDSLAVDLRRGVAIDDPRLRLLAHSAHRQPVDSIRQQSIIARQVSQAVVDWALGLRLADVQGPVRTPANPGLGLDERVCVPIRCHGRLLGYLWVLDPGGSSTDGELRSCQKAAEDAGAVLYRHRLLHEISRSRERELLRDLLGEDEPARRHAAVTLVDEGLLAAGRAVVLAVEIVGGASPVQAELEVGLGQALERGRRMLPARSAVELQRGTVGLLVVAVDALGQADGGPPGVGARLRDLADGELAPASAQALVGVGAVAPSLWGARESHEQARRGLRIAARIPSFERLVSWEGAGVYQLLVQLPLDEGAIVDVNPRILGLLEHESLTTTLETYLDHAGDAKATSQALTLHRASLYYRLARIEQLLEVDLKRGEDRLALHLVLKLLRLAGAGRPAARTSGEGEPMRAHSA